MVLWIHWVTHGGNRLPRILLWLRGKLVDIVVNIAIFIVICNLHIKIWFVFSRQCDQGFNGIIGPTNMPLFMQKVLEVFEEYSFFNFVRFSAGLCNCL